jgi:hypothetical protein
LFKKTEWNIKYGFKDNIKLGLRIAGYEDMNLRKVASERVK